MGGGDQIYNDGVWAVPSLKAWLAIEKTEVGTETPDMCSVARMSCTMQQALHKQAALMMCWLPHVPAHAWEICLLNANNIRCVHIAIRLLAGTGACDLKSRSSCSFLAVWSLRSGCCMTSQRRWNCRSQSSTLTTTGDCLSIAQQFPMMLIQVAWINMHRLVRNFITRNPLVSHRVHFNARPALARVYACIPQVSS